VRLEKPKLDDHTNEITSMTQVVSFVQQIKAVENTVFYGFFFASTSIPDNQQ